MRVREIDCGLNTGESGGAVARCRSRVVARWRNVKARRAVFVDGAVAVVVNAVAAVGRRRGREGDARRDVTTDAGRYGALARS
jgi:hypothetical protein